jgi:hypothetical protein
MKQLKIASQSLFFLIYFSLTLFKVSAQVNNDTNLIYSSLSTDVSFSIHSNLPIEAYSLSGQKFLSHQDKLSLYGQLRPRTGLELNQDYRIRYHSPFKVFRSEWRISGSASYRSSLEVSFPKNAGSLLLFGNTQYKGREEQFDRIIYKSLRYSQISLGLRKLIKQSKYEHRIQTGISLNLGHDYLAYEIDRAALYTESNGDMLRFSIRGSINQTDTFYKQDFSVRGWGSGIYCQHIISYPGGEIQYSLRDFGFIRWNRQPLSWKKDTTYTFSGWDIPNIFDITEKPYQNTSDSLYDAIGGQKSKGMYTFTPFKIELSYFHYLKGWLSGIGIYSIYKHQSVNRFEAGVFPRVRISKRLYLDLLLATNTIIPFYSNVGLHYKSDHYRLGLAFSSAENLIPFQGRKLDSSISIIFVKYIKP